MPSSDEVRVSDTMLRDDDELDHMILSTEEQSDVDIRAERVVMGSQTVHRIRTTCWVASVIFFLLYIEKLMLNPYYNDHAPATISFLTFALLSIFYGIAICLGSRPGSFGLGKLQTLKSSAWGISWTERQQLMPSQEWVGMVPASFAAALALPMLLGAVSRMPGLYLLVMIFPAIYVVETAVVSIRCPQLQKVPVGVALALVSLCSIILLEPRLELPGLLQGSGGILCVGIARGLLILTTDDASTTSAVRLHAFRTMTLGVGFVLTGIMKMFFGTVPVDRSPPYSLIILLYAMVMAVVLFTLTGDSVLSYTPLSLSDTDYPSAKQPEGHLSNLYPEATYHVAWVLLSFSKAGSTCSLAQAIAFLVAIVGIVGLGRIHATVVTTMDITRDIFFRPSHQKSKFSALSAGSFAWAVFMAILWALLFFQSSRSSSLQTATSDPDGDIPPVKLDKAFTPPSRFDIVVSMYSESTESVQEMLDSVKSTKLLRALQPNVIIYTKNSTADLELIKSSTGANVVERLDNRGREGATYLHHIVNHWDQLAKQTIFLQAHPHNLQDLTPRIDHYLTPWTGMLSLDFVNLVCDADTCSDGFGWKDEFGIVPRLFHEMYNITAASHKVLLTYKGQFIASGRRIRAIPKKIYEELLDAMTRSDGWGHEPELVEGHIDDVDNPWLGLSLERVWGVLMQCAMEQRIMSHCPSFLQGMESWGDPRDCQCYDE